MLGWELPPHNSGGLGVACYHMAKALARAGASIDFVLPYAAFHPDTEFMTIHSTTNLDPLHKMGMGAYDTHTELKIDLPDGTPAVGLRSIQKKYISYVEKHVRRLRRIGDIGTNNFASTYYGAFSRFKLGNLAMQFRSVHFVQMRAYVYVMVGIDEAVHPTGIGNKWIPGNVERTHKNTIYAEIIDIFFKTFVRENVYGILLTEKKS